MDWPINNGILIHPSSYYKLIDQGRQSSLKKIRDEFIIEVTRQDPEWVKERRLDYLRQEAIKAIHWFNIVLLFNLFPTKTAQKLKNIVQEIKIWTTNEPYHAKNGDLSDEMIEKARNTHIERFIEVKRQFGENKLAICPFHDDHNPSLVLYPEGRGYYCFSCNTGGDTIDFIMRLHNLDFKSAVKYILNL